MTISELRQRSNRFTADLDRTIADIMEGSEDLIILNRKQLKESKLADGSTIDRDYSPMYADYKRTFYPSSYADGRVNLLLTGALYDSLRIKVQDKQYFVVTNVSYAGKLTQKYGQWAGIAPENLPRASQIVIGHLKREFQERVLS